MHVHVCAHVGVGWPKWLWQVISVEPSGIGWSSKRQCQWTSTEAQLLFAITFPAATTAPLASFCLRYISVV